MKLNEAFCIYGFVLSSWINTASCATTHMYPLVWADEFDGGSLDRGIWSYDLGTGENGWGNGELQSYTEANVAVSGSSLQITVIKDDATNTFTSGRVKTVGNLEFQYGRLAARIKIPDVVEGLWPAFWTLGANFPVVDWPASGEIDIMEIGQGAAIVDGVGNRRVISGAHWKLPNGATAHYPGNLTVAADLHNGFHLYEMDWTDTSLTTYVDGQMIWTMDLTCASCGAFHKPHFMILNVAVGGGFTAGSSSSSSDDTSSECGSSSGTGSSGGCSRTPDQITAPLPGTMFVDYVHLYNNGFTQLYGPAPSQVPSQIPSSQPSAAPVASPDPPTKGPSEMPSATPSGSPVEPPTKRPSDVPSAMPSSSPILDVDTAGVPAPPSTTPSSSPSESPVDPPTKHPSKMPSATPSNAPVDPPTRQPSKMPSATPSNAPVEPPIAVDVADVPDPKAATDSPSSRPSAVPTSKPSTAPSQSPTCYGKGGKGKKEEDSGKGGKGGKGKSGKKDQDDDRRVLTSTARAINHERGDGKIRKRRIHSICEDDDHGKAGKGKGGKSSKESGKGGKGKGGKGSSDHHVHDEEPAVEQSSTIVSAGGPAQSDAGGQSRNGGGAVTETTTTSDAESENSNDGIEGKGTFAAQDGNFASSMMAENGVGGGQPSSAVVTHTNTLLGTMFILFVLPFLIV